MNILIKGSFFTLTLLLCFNVFAQHDHEIYDQKGIQEAEKLIKIFDKRFKIIILDQLNSGADYDLFYKAAINDIARDRRLFFGKVVHGEINEAEIDLFIQNNLLRVYKNIHTDFLNEKKKYSINKNESFRPESIGDPCNNVDFESGTTAGWQGWTGIASTDLYPSSTSLISGFTPTQHEIISGTTYDPIVGGSLLSRVAPGGNYSLRLENTSIGGNLSRISQTFLVNPANANFTYKYAVVLEDPSSSHTDPERPYFKIRVSDQSGNEILCGRYEVIAKPPITGFQQVSSTNYYWRDWTSVAIPLAPYVGQNVTVEFTASDCALTGHLGYAYIDGSCFQSSIISTPSGSCGGLPYTLTAPPGYASYAWTGPNIVGANNVQTVTVNQTGTYACVITSVSGPSCKATLKAVVGASSTVNAGPDFNICPGGYAQLNANVSLTNSFTWSPATGLTNPNTLNPIARPTVTTKYYLTACGKTDSVVVNVDTVGFSITPDFTTCGTSSVSLSAAPTVAGSYTYSWSPTTGMIGANTSNPAVSLSATTTYSVTVTNTNTGCSKTKLVTVTVSSSGVTNAGPDKYYCGTPVQINVTGGSTFTWTDINGNAPTGLSCSNCNNPKASPAVTTSYIVSSNLSSPCKIKDTIVVYASTPLIVNLGNDTTLCKGSTLLLNASNAGSGHLWSTGSTGQSISVSIAGIYWVDVNNGICPVKRDSIIITYKTNPVVNLGKDTILCVGNSILLNALNTGAGYLWSTGAVSQTISASTSGTYWVDVNNGVCPVKRDTILIGNKNKPVVNFGNDTILCAGSTLLLNAYNAGSGHIWSTGASSQTILVSIAGIYWVDINNGSCPVKRDTVIVTYKTNPIVNLGKDTILCVGNSILLNALNAGAGYLWSTGAISQTISVSAAGVYWVDVNNGICPVKRDTIVIGNKNKPLVDLGNDTTLCNGNSLLLNASNVSSGYIWSTGAINPTILVNTAGKYSVIVNNGVCPLVKDSILVSFVAAPLANLGNDTSICTGKQLSLNVRNTGLGYQWSTGAVTRTISVNSQGYYWVEVDNGVCPKVRDSLYLTIVSYPVVNIGPDKINCITSQVTFDAGNIAYPVSWSNGAISQTITPNVSGIYWVDVANGRCITRDSAILTYVPISTVNFGSDTTACNGTSVTLTVLNPGISYAWSTGAGSQSISVNGPGNYWVDVDNGYCVLKRYNVLVSYVSPPVADLGDDSVLVCYNDTLKLDAGNAGDTYQWYNNKNDLFSVSKQVVFHNNHTGYYKVFVNNGICTREDSVYIKFTQNQQPLRDTVICMGKQILLKAGVKLQSYVWQNGSTDSTYLASASDLIQDTIKIKIKDIYGCRYIDSMILFAVDCSVEELFIPNLITPNNDNQNDRFHIKGLPQESILYIFNRWGDLVYSNTDYDNSWGTESVSEGVYYYTLKFNDERQFKGWLQVIK